MKIESIANTASSAYGEKEHKTPKIAEDVSRKKQEGTSSLNTIEKTVSIKNSMLSQDTAKEDRETKEGQAREKQIKNAIFEANKKIRRPNTTSLEFSYHEETQRVSIQVIDQETKEIIREIPPEKSLDMLQKMWELAGILVDEKR
ncbi:MAG: flagellar protein FlaG [Acetivibrio sp.]